MERVMIKLKTTKFNGMTPSIEYFELNNDMYNEILATRNLILRVYNLESSFDNLIEAYKDFKVAIHRENVNRLTMGGKLDYVFNHESRARLNRCLNSVLNQSKFYMDSHVYKGQQKSFLLNVTGEPELHKLIVEEYVAEHHANGLYFLGSVLRNIAQHRSSLVDNLSVGFDGGLADETIVARFTLPLSKQSILDDPKIKNYNKLAISESNCVLDVNVILDGFVHSISKFQTRNRELSKKAFDSAWDYWERLTSELQKKHSTTANSFEIVEFDEGGNEQQHFNTCTDWMQVVPHLRNKNYGLIDPSKVELSNKPRNS
jgi:hypothetical protein